MFGTVGPSGREGGLGKAIALRARTKGQYFALALTKGYSLLVRTGTVLLRIIIQRHPGHELVRVVTLQRFQRRSQLNLDSRRCKTRTGVLIADDAHTHQSQTMRYQTFLSAGILFVTFS